MQAEELRKSKKALANAVLSVLAILCAITDNELNYYGSISEVHSNALRCLLISISAVQVVLTVHISRESLKLQKVLGFKHASSMH